MCLAHAATPADFFILPLAVSNKAGVGDYLENNWPSFVLQENEKPEDDKTKTIFMR